MIQDINHFEQKYILYDNLYSVFEVLKNRGLNDFCIVCYTVNEFIRYKVEKDETQNTKLDSPRKRVREERRSKEQDLLRETYF